MVSHKKPAAGFPYLSKHLRDLRGGDEVPLHPKDLALGVVAMLFIGEALLHQIRTLSGQLYEEQAWPAQTGHFGRGPHRDVLCDCDGASTKLQDTAGNCRRAQR